MHEPVLLHESIEALDINPDGVYVDATFGGGGHSREILNRLGAQGKLFGFDQDEAALSRVINDDRFLLINENFRYVHRFLRLHGVRQVDGILADLGMSSFQLDSDSRGFSTRFDAPLDMRMKQQNSKTAADVLNMYSVKELQTLFQNYGELRNAKSLAKHIDEERNHRLMTTTSDFIERIKPMVKGNPHRYLAQVFQALRIEVNEEMLALKKFLINGARLLKANGRFAIITFHSLEDRLVKRYFKFGTFTGQPEKDVYGNFEAPLVEVNRKPIGPSDEEIKKNSRSRSAKLRIAIKKNDSGDRK